MPAVPWTETSLDFLTSLPTLDGKSTVLVVVRHFSKMLILIPFGETTDAKSVAAAYLPTVGSWVMLQHVMVGNTQWKLHKAGGSWGNGR